MKPSEFLKSAKDKIPSIITGGSQILNISEEKAFDMTKKDMIETIDRASAALFLCNNDLYSAIKLLESLEQENRQ